MISHADPQLKSRWQKMFAGQKDFVFIDYEDMQSCQRAVEAMHNKPFDTFSTGPMKVI
jgi:hypothetical protein